jgi:hypothetical protein
MLLFNRTAAGPELAVLVSRRLLQRQQTSASNFLQRLCASWATARQSTESQTAILERQQQLDAWDPQFRLRHASLCTRPISQARRMPLEQ